MAGVKDPGIPVVDGTPSTVGPTDTNVGLQNLLDDVQQLRKRESISHRSLEERIKARGIKFPIAGDEEPMDARDIDAMLGLEDEF